MDHTLIFSQQKKIANFVEFLYNNNVFMQESQAFKKYQPQEKFIFPQLVANFDSFWQNNGRFVQKKLCIQKYHSQKNYFDSYL